MGFGFGGFDVFSTVIFVLVGLVFCFVFGATMGRSIFRVRATSALRASDVETGKIKIAPPCLTTGGACAIIDKLTATSRDRAVGSSSGS